MDGLAASLRRDLRVEGGLRRFCRRLVSEEILDVDPMEGMEPPQTVDTPVDMFSDDDLNALIKACTWTRRHSS